MIDSSKCYACIGCTWEREISSQSQIDNCKDYRPRPKPTRYEKFREQTATIDGWIEWQRKYHMDCDFCANYPDKCPCTTKYTQEELDAYCKAGVKAYWEGEV